MPKVSRRPLPKEDWEKYFDQMIEAIHNLKRKKDLYAFFNDLWTHTEKKMLSKRFQIARRLLEGVSYDVIEAGLKVTANTVAAVSDEIEVGRGGFEDAHQILEKIEKKKEKDKAAKMKNAIESWENPIGLRRK